MPQYQDADIQVTTWTNIELGTTHGYKFPCGKTYPSEFFTRYEALESHNYYCNMCDSIKDLRKVKSQAEREQIKEIRRIKERLGTIVSMTKLIGEDGTKSQEYKDLSVRLEQLKKELA